MWYFIIKSLTAIERIVSCPTPLNYASGLRSLNFTWSIFWCAAQFSKYKEQQDSKGFWWWCLTVGISVWKKFHFGVVRTNPVFQLSKSSWLSMIWILSSSPNGNDGKNLLKSCKNLLDVF
jgi:hypothetical protein